MMRIAGIVSLLLASLTLATCRSSPPPPPASANEIADYFLNPSEAKFTDLSTRPADPAALNAALRALRKPAMRGMQHEWLNDSAGALYLVGFRTPDSVARDTSYPLIIYLHGGIGSTRSDKGDSAFLMLAALADTFKLFLASPSGNRFTPWWSPNGLSRILQTVRFMTLRYPVNPRKIFLAGVSDGATGCFAAANSVPAPFAGFIAVSGFGGMLPQLGMELSPVNLRQRPIYDVNAGLDHIYPFDSVKGFVNQLAAQGIPITFKAYPNEKHGFDYRMKEMGTLAGFVRSWSKPAPRTVVWNFVPGVPNLPDNILDYTLSSENASVNSFWQKDTLVAKAQGVSSMDILFPQQIGEKVECRIIGDKKKEMTLKPVKIDWPNSLKLMLRSCFPEVKGGWFYSLKIQ
jgi:acetyl esterase/lipase